MNTSESIVSILRSRDKIICGLCLLYITMFAVIMTTCFHEISQSVSFLFGAFIIYGVIRSIIAGYRCSNLNRWIQENAFEQPPHLRKSVWLPRVICIYFSIWAAFCYIGTSLISIQEAEGTILVFILGLVLTIGFVLGLGIIAFLALMPIVTGEQSLENKLEENYLYMCYKRDRMLAFQCFFVGLMILVLGGYWYAYFQGSGISNNSTAILSPYFMFPFVHLSLKTKFIQNFSKMRKLHRQGYVVSKSQKILWKVLGIFFFALLIVSTGAIVYSVFMLFTTHEMNNLIWWSGVVGSLVFVNFMYVFQLYSPFTANNTTPSKRLA